MIVADTNLVAYLLIEGERTGEVRHVWERDPDWRLPALWRSEFLNVLTLAARSGDLDRDRADRAWLRAITIFGRREEHPSGSAVLDEALTSALSAYDAQFVVVARTLGVPFVTADQRILRACPDLAMAPADFAGGKGAPP